VKEILIIMVKLYQAALAPWLGGRCRYVPTCSAYMIEALETRGVVHGVSCGLERLLRCHPWGDHGHDPVPHPMKGGQNPL